MNEDRSLPMEVTSDFRSYVESNEHLRRLIKVNQNDSTGILEALVDLEVISSNEKDDLEDKLNPDKIRGALIVLLARRKDKLQDIISAFSCANALEVANIFRNWQQEPVQVKPTATAPVIGSYSLRMSNDNLVPTLTDQLYDTNNVHATEIEWSQPFPEVTRNEDTETTSRLRQCIPKTEYYEAGKAKSRYALVVNNINFPYDKDSKKKCRAGGGLQDAMRVNQVLTRCGFKLFYIQDCLKQDLKEPGTKLDQFIDFVQSKKASAVAVFLMSHGTANNMMQMNDSTDQLDTWLNYDEEVVEKFSNHNCPGLVGVPKMFFFQLCRGNLNDEGLTTDSSGAQLLSRECKWNPFPNDRASGGSKHHEPTFSDMLLAYSCHEGFSSWKVGDMGSWFIQTLCDAITIDREQQHPLDVTELLSKVNQVIRNKAVEDIVYITETRKTETTYWKQICPFFNIAFSKKFYFNPTSPAF